MSASSLAAEMKAAGLTVIEDSGWASRGNKWAASQPIGQMIHHTAPPVPFPVPRLNGSDDGKIKCNANIKQDGKVYLIAYLAANYASGGGSSVVYNETLAKKAPPANALARGLTDNMVGNAYYWNVECDAPGDGSPIPKVMYEAIVTASAVTGAHFKLVPNQVISHAEWTARKIDPYWNGSSRTAAAIRASLEDDMSSPKNWDADDIAAWRSMLNNTIIKSTESNFAFYVRNTYALAYEIREIVKGLTAGELADMAVVANAVADEIDRRERERLGPG